MATNLNTSMINSNSLRLNYTAGSASLRLISVTPFDDIVYLPINGVKYDYNLRYGKGDQLVGTSNDICYPYYPYPDPIDPQDIYSNSTTFVVYSGSNDGSNGIDIINLKPNSKYKIIVYENDHYCYSDPSEIIVTTGFEVNYERFEIKVFDNRTRLPIKNASIAFKNVQEFISDTGLTDENGLFYSVDMEEGRYEMSVVADNYESKVLSGLFVQRDEPRRDNYYRIFTSYGTTEFGSGTEREFYRNKNSYNVYLDPFDTTYKSFTKYNSSPNPSHKSKL